MVYRRDDGNIGWIDPAAQTENAGAALAARSAMALIHQAGWHMHLADLIGPEAVIASLKVKTKKQLLQELSARAARLTGLAGALYLRHPAPA